MEIGHELGRETAKDKPIVAVPPGTSTQLINKLLDSFPGVLNLFGNQGQNQNQPQNQGFFEKPENLALTGLALFLILKYGTK